MGSFLEIPVEETWLNFQFNSHQLAKGKKRKKKNDRHRPRACRFKVLDDACSIEQSHRMYVYGVRVVSRVFEFFFFFFELRSHGNFQSQENGARG